MCVFTTMVSAIPKSRTFTMAVPDGLRFSVRSLVQRPTRARKFDPRSNRQPTLHLGDHLDYYYEDSDIPVPHACIGKNYPGDIYVLTVNGLSMIDAIINNRIIGYLKTSGSCPKRRNGRTMTH